MSNFLFVYRADYPSMPKGSPEEMQAITKSWMDWIGGIAAQNKLASAGSSLAGAGKVVRSNQVITDGPYMEIKELIGGYSIVNAESLEEAAALTAGCPIFEVGGSVEVRPVNVM